LSDLDLYIMTLSELCLNGISIISYLCGIWSTTAKTGCNCKRATIVSQTKHDTWWDRVDFHKEWFWGGDLEGLEIFGHFLFSVDGNTT
jgi:hypothetical protein